MDTIARLIAWLKKAVREHWLSIVILVAPINWVVYQADKADAITPMLPLPVTALVVGYVLRPRHVWLVWLGSVVVQLATMGVWGRYGNPGDETVLSLFLEAFIWMFLGVLIPVFIGRFVRTRIRVDQKPGRARSA